MSDDSSRAFCSVALVSIALFLKKIKIKSYRGDFGIAEVKDCSE